METVDSPDQRTEDTQSVVWRCLMETPLSILMVYDFRLMAGVHGKVVLLNMIPIPLLYRAISACTCTTQG